MSRPALFALSLLAGAAAQATAQRPAAPPDLDRYVQQVTADYDVPGLALTIVKDGKVVVFDFQDLDLRPVPKEQP